MEELYEKILMNWIIMMVCSVNQSQTFWCVKSKTALGRTAFNKASGCNAIPVEVFEPPEDEAFMVLHSICLQIWKIQQWPQDWKKINPSPNSPKG